jgi:hypothetical protein
VGATFGVGATGAGAAAAFAALIAAHRALVEATIARRPAALSLRFAGGLGAGAPGASRIGIGTVGPLRASIALVNLSFSLTSKASMWSIAKSLRLTQRREVGWRARAANGAGSAVDGPPRTVRVEEIGSEHPAGGMGKEHLQETAGYIYNLSDRWRDALRWV